jgi:hypothetical protein
MKNLSALLILAVADYSWLRQTAEKVIERFAE